MEGTEDILLTIEKQNNTKLKKKSIFSQKYHCSQWVFFFLKVKELVLLEFFCNVVCFEFPYSI